MDPSMNGSSWSSCRKMTSPLASSMRLGCWGLKACSGGIGIFVQGPACAGAGAEADGFGCGRRGLCAAGQASGQQHARRDREREAYFDGNGRCSHSGIGNGLYRRLRFQGVARRVCQFAPPASGACGCAGGVNSMRALVRLLSTKTLLATRRTSALVTLSTRSSSRKSSRQSP